LVHWFPSCWGELFLTFLKLYITHCRSQRNLHPFLFVSQKARFKGDPYTVDSYRQAHARAVRRIGLFPARSTGTTPHGHRHAYGQRLADVGVDELTIQRVMHHKSPTSQVVYTEAPAAKIGEVLATAQQRLADIEHERMAFLESDIRFRQLLGRR
jgi:integrase